MILPCRGSHPLGASLLPAWGMIVRGITSGLRSPQPVGLSSRDFRRLPKIKKDFGDRERQPPRRGHGLIVFCTWEPGHLFLASLPS